MTRKIFGTVMGILLVLTLTSIVAAECPKDKYPINVTTPSGIQKVLCVPAAAVDGLENAADHSAGTIVSAVCDCITPEELAVITQKYGFSCVSTIDKFGYVVRVECDTDIPYSGTRTNTHIILYNGLHAQYECKDYFFSDDDFGFSADVFDACVALLAPYTK